MGSSITSGDLEVARQWLLAGIERKRGFFLFEREKKYLEELGPQELNKIASSVNDQAPSSVEAIKVPKSGQEFRTVPWINVRDNLIATASIAASYPMLYDGLKAYQGKIDHCNALSADPKSTEWIGNWREGFHGFKDRTRSHEKAGRFVFQGDIRAFGSSCDANKVLDTLNNLGMAGDHRVLLEKYLSAWSNTAGVNMPEGTVLIDFLLKAALLPVDERCVNSDLNYYRYNDDICLVADTKEQLLKDVDTLSNILKAEGFELNSRKSKITGPGIEAKSLYLDQYFDPVMRDLGYDLRFADLDTESIPIDVLEAVYEQHISPRRKNSSPVWQTVFNFTLGRLGKAGSEIALKDLSVLLSENPDRAERVISYAGRAGFNDEAIDQIDSYLNSANEGTAYHRYILCDIIKDPDINAPQPLCDIILGWQEDTNQPDFVRCASSELAQVRSTDVSRSFDL